MIEELKKMIFDKLNQQTEIQDYQLNCQCLQNQILDLKELNIRLQRRAEKAEEDLKIALDEIAQNQVRIHALLKQLQDKNGGR